METSRPGALQPIGWELKLWVKLSKGSQQEPQEANAVEMGRNGGKVRRGSGELGKMLEAHFPGVSPW